ncbi:hypothetical protein, partial [Pseudomonas syringae group genomosp. 7]|uniref:hypothetical protein n=1 Tax=Pseudomonas syringae group genomosp. 7 TaxID=251699 RepID=UPI00376FA1CB
SQSYGLAVAQIAGVPGKVITRAMEHLQRLETTSLRLEQPKAKPGKPAVPQQSDKFASLPHPLLHEQKKDKVDELTQRQEKD